MSSYLLYIKLEIIITEEYDGVSPKNFLKKRLNVSYSKLVKLLKDKRITINKKKIKQDTILAKGDVIKIWDNTIELRDTKENKETKSENLNINTIYEEKDFLAINKKPGIVVQGAAEKNTSLVLHLNYLKEQNNDELNEYNYVHRLDKDTSGVLLIGKNSSAIRELNKIFKSKEIKKTYVCLCDGLFEEKEGTIEVTLSRMPDNSFEKVSVGDSGSFARETKSHYKVIDEYEFQNQSFSLVEVVIETGFMHQIRVHMKHIKHPIIGDDMYGNRFVNSMFEELLPRQFLHARKLEFEYNGKEYKIKAKLSNDLNKALNNMKKIV